MDNDSYTDGVEYLNTRNNRDTRPTTHARSQILSEFDKYPAETILYDCKYPSDLNLNSDNGFSKRIRYHTIHFEFAPLTAVIGRLVFTVWMMQLTKLLHGYPQREQMGCMQSN